MMRNLVPYVAAFFFAVFVLGVFAAMMLYSWQGLANIFPDDLLGQGFGMLMFDAAALVWFAAMVYRSRSVGQYVISFIGFLVGLVGTLGLIGIEVGLSSGMFERADMVQPLTYIFIGVLVGHVVLVYAHHAASPEMAAGISLGIEKAKITDRAEKDATDYLTANIQGLSKPIAKKLVQRVMEDLSLGHVGGDVIDLPALPAESKSNGHGGGSNFLNWFPRFWVDKDKQWNLSTVNAANSLKSRVPKPAPAPRDVVKEQKTAEKMAEPLYHPHYYADLQLGSEAASSSPSPLDEGGDH